MGPNAQASLGDRSRAGQGGGSDFLAGDGLNDISEASRNLLSILLKASPETDKVSVPENNLSDVVKRIELQLGALDNFISTFNQLPQPSPGRHAGVGALMIPFAVQALSATSHVKGEERLFLESYERTHTDKTTNQLKVTFSPLLGAIPQYLAVEAHNGALPAPEKYIEHTLDDGLRGKCAGFMQQRQAAEVDLAALMKTVNERKKQPEFEDPLAGPIAKAQGQIAGATASIHGLFMQNLRDVSPERVPECISGVGAMVAPSATVVSNILKLHAELEKLLVSIGTFKDGDPGITISLPALGGTGKMIFADFELSPQYLKNAGSDPVLLGNLLQTYSEARKMVFAVHRSLPQFQSLKAFQSSLEFAMQAPLQSFEGEGTKTFQKLFSHNDIGLTQALFSLLGQTYLTGAGSKTEATLIESAASAAPVLWAVRNYLRGDTEAQIQAHDLLEQSPVMSKELLPLLAKIRGCLDSHDFVALSQILTKRIDETSGKDKGLFESLSPILALSALSQERQIAQKLKNQIPNTDSLLKRIDELEGTSVTFLSEIREVTAHSISRLSATLADYYQEPEMAAYWDYLERFAAFVEDPGCIHGLPGNEAMSGGVLLKGPPGVGKSYLVECTERQYGFKSFSTAPDKDTKGDGEDILLNAAKKAFEEAVQYVTNEKKPCFLFIDEAETMMPDRKNPRTSHAGAALTGYGLRELNEIRRRFPQISIIIATNYPEDLDPALLRIGRIDIQVEMKAPGEELRALIIEDTLQKSPVQVTLTEEQLKQVVASTDGFIPLQIVQCINELTRIDPLVAKRRGEQFSVNFESLKAKFEAESRRRKDYESEIELRKRQSEAN